MKIAHLTDLHIQVTPRLQDLVGKRLLGTANLYLAGRRARFTRAAQAAAIQATLDLEPDLVIITGDLSAQALDAEFSAARGLLAPVLARFPTVIIAGNHDTYVREAFPGSRMRQVFGPWMGEPGAHLHRFGQVSILTLETCRTHPLSSGWVQPERVTQARSLVAEKGDSFLFLAIHYPLRGRDGGPYGPATRALSNAPVLEAMLAETPGVDAIIHGHEHHGFRTTLSGPDGEVPILNPGASGYAWQPDRDRTAHLNVYEVDQRRLTSVERLAFDGERFSAEPGGAYATRR